LAIETLLCFRLREERQIPAYAFLAAAAYLTIGIASYVLLLGDITPIPEPE